MATLSRHRLTDWLNGVPWYFYFVFIVFKLPPLPIAAFVVGLPQLLRRRTGDGRYFMLFWLFYWVATFVFAGGKFTRYFTTALPCVLIAAALGLEVIGDWLARAFSLKRSAYARLSLVALVLVASTVASAESAPHYRLHFNLFGGGPARAG